MRVSGMGAGRVYAFRCEDPEAQVRRQMSGLAVVCSGSAALARALRSVRKAAFRGGAGYDPARHAALLRLARTRSGRGHPEAGGPWDAAPEGGAS